VVDLKIWQWFCKLGDKQRGHIVNAKHPVLADRQVSERVSQSGVDVTCSRVCGNDGCRCGSTIRGLHCVWSYYRLEQ